MRGFPAWYPDMNVWADDCPARWPVNIEHNGVPQDLTGLSLAAPVTYNDEIVGTLTLEIVNASRGKLDVILSRQLFETLNHYSLWYLRDNAKYKSPLVCGRIVKWS